MNQFAENNPNWKGGVSSNNYRYTKKSRERYPEREIARKRVARAIKSGKLKRPENCQFPRCENKEVFAHHRDYLRPLVVEWYCREHHNEIDEIDRIRREQDENLSHRFNKPPEGR